jgi:hypothetical protein
MYRPETGFGSDADRGNGKQGKQMSCVHWDAPCNRE